MSTATAVKERGIIMGAESVKAILAGRKTQTRRVVKPQPPSDEYGEPYSGRIFGPEWYEPEVEDRDGDYLPGEPIFGIYDEDGEWGVRCPYKPGDRLYVKEAHFYCTWDYRNGSEEDDGDGPYIADLVAFRENPRKGRRRWHGRTAGHSITYLDPSTEMEYHGYLRAMKGRSPLFMPRWASRLALEITEVRVERLHEISEEDACAEGMAALAERYSTLQGTFRAHWDRLNGKKHPWESNPWIWAISFRPVKP